MQCESPITVSKPIHKRQFHNDTHDVPCGRCTACLQNKRTDWTLRLEQEWKNSQNSHFVTLTYSDDNLPLGKYDVPTLYKDDISQFNKKLRSRVDRFWNKWTKYAATEPIFKPYESYHKKMQYIRLEGLKPMPIRFYSIGEYGEKFGRPHYHGIYFNIPDKIIGSLEDIWGLGNIDVGQCEMASIHYVTKYMINRYEKDDMIVQPPFAQMSRRPGIGSTYIKDKGVFHLERYEQPYLEKGEFKHRIPRYWKDNIFLDTHKHYQRVHTHNAMSYSERLKDDELKRRGLNPDEYKKQLLEQRKNRIIKNSKSKDT